MFYIVAIIINIFNQITKRLYSIDGAYLYPNVFPSHCYVHSVRRSSPEKRCSLWCLIGIYRLCTIFNLWSCLLKKWIFLRYVQINSWVHFLIRTLIIRHDLRFSLGFSSLCRHVFNSWMILFHSMKFFGRKYARVWCQGWLAFKAFKNVSFTRELNLFKIHSTS